MCCAFFMIALNYEEMNITVFEMAIRFYHASLNFTPVGWHHVPLMSCP